MKTAKQLGITPTQRKNLAKLIMFVRDKAEPPRFDMNAFFAKNNAVHIGTDFCPNIKEYECGTTACFLGYGIPAGIKAYKQEMWRDYSWRAFGINMAARIDRDNDAYDFLFHESHENSKEASVLRGAWFLMNGLPDNAEDLEYWETPSDFKPNWNAIEEIANQ